MIGYIEGKIIEINPQYVLINTSGVGYKVYSTSDTLLLLKKKKSVSASFYTHLSVRENALDLYGFESKDELNFFEELISISGIGPKSAIGILNLATVSTLKAAINAGDPSRLTKISGIGMRTAQKIVLELKDKIIFSESESQFNLHDEHDVIETLKALGYGEREAREVVKKLDKNGTTSAKVKEALKILGKSE